MQPVKNRVLQMAECPATPRTIRLVKDVAGAIGLSIAVEQVFVETLEQAQALAFVRSPTVQFARYGFVLPSDLPAGR